MAFGFWLAHARDSEIITVFEAARAELQRRGLLPPEGPPPPEEDQR